MNRILRITLVLASCAMCPAMQQAVVPAAGRDQASAQQSDLYQQLTEIQKERDPGKRAGQLEQFIRNHPDFPRLESAYSSLLTTLATSNLKEAVRAADAVLAKYTDPKTSVYRTAYRVKFAALSKEKKEAEIDKLGQKILNNETNPILLQMVAQYDRENSLKLLEKAIAERGKDPSTTAAPALDDLRWNYARSLGQAGRNEEASRLSLDLIDATRKNIAEMEALPNGDPQKRGLQIVRSGLASRYQTVASFLSSAGQYQKALEYLDLSEQSSGVNATERRPSLERARAGIYAKMGKPDLELECYTRAFAVEMDLATRDKIIASAKKSGKNPEEVFERARQIRNENAVPIYAFELKTFDGKPMTLSSIRSKVTLVNFFFPT